MVTEAERGVRSVVHVAVHLERAYYEAPVARVWKALTDEKAKQKWFGGARAAGSCWSATLRYASAAASG
jgi:uncharacterized protein YndB with AHSA1/START domain